MLEMKLNFYEMYKLYIIASEWLLQIHFLSFQVQHHTWVKEMLRSQT